MTHSTACRIQTRLASRHSLGALEITLKGLHWSSSLGRLDQSDLLSLGIALLEMLLNLAFGVLGRVHHGVDCSVALALLTVFGDLEMHVH